MHYLVARAARRALPVVLLAVTACGAPARSSTPPPSTPTPTPPPTSDGNTVTGTERIGWEQALLEGSSPAEYTYSWFVDDLRAGSAAATCAPQSEAMLTCSAPLPKLTPGPHRMRVSAIRAVPGGAVESSRSEALNVVQLGSGLPTLTDGAKAAAREVVAPPDLGGGPASAERISVIARGLAPVSDLAVAGDLVVIAERSGTLRLVRGGVILPERALAVADVIANAPGLGLLAVAAHPDFVTNHEIYFLYTAESRTGPIYRVARGREVGGRIGEVAVLLDGVEAALSGWAALRFGPDGKLYAAFAAPGGAERDGSYAGHILRLNDDGTTPRDNPGATPVIAAVGGAPLALTWSETGELGIVRALPDGRRDFLPSLAQTTGTQPWRANEQPAGAAYYPAALPPERSGSLLVGLMDGGIGQMEAAPRSGVARRIAASFGAVRALAIAPTGEIYAATANGDLSARAATASRQDVLLCVTNLAR